MKSILVCAGILAIPLVAYLAPAGAQPDKATSNSNEEAIHKLVRDYVLAYNSGNAEAATQYFAKDAEITDENGTVTKGRDAIRQAIDKTMKSGKALRVEASIVSCRALVPDACSVELATTMQASGGLPVQNKCHLIVAKRDGQWLIAEARESRADAESETASPLNDLAWMVGDWADTSDRVDVRINSEWFANKRFLVRNFTVMTDGELDLQGTEIVGYDAAAKQIRSWVFDSDGSFSEGTWVRDGATWRETMRGTLEDGRKATAIHSFSPKDGNSYVFTSSHREVGGQVQPSIGDIRMVRQSTSEAAHNGKER